MKIRDILLTATLAVSVVAGATQAAVVAGPTVGGLATFTDTSTGRDWLKLNDFFNTSGTAMIAAATTAGFTVATRADVVGLTDTLPLDGTSATFGGYAAIMGSAPNRALIWGAYTPDPSASLGWAFAFDYNATWQFVDNAYPASGVANGGTQYADENLWAFTAGSGTPEAATWAMMIAGFGLVGTALRRRPAVLAA